MGHLQLCRLPYQRLLCFLSTERLHHFSSLASSLYLDKGDRLSLLFGAAVAFLDHLLLCILCQQALLGKDHREQVSRVCDASEDLLGREARP